MKRCSMRLCDDAGMVSEARVEVASTGAASPLQETYLERHNRMVRTLASVDQKVESEPFTCSGSAHFGNLEFVCSSPAHRAHPPMSDLTPECVTSPYGYGRQVCGERDGGDYFEHVEGCPQFAYCARTPNREPYSAAWPIQTESGRTGIVTCLRCGAAVILDRDIDTLKLHNDWHDRLEPAQPENHCG